MKPRVKLPYLLLWSAALGTGIAAAQDYPAKPIRMIVGFPPGGGTDVMARLVAPKMTEAWNQQVVIDNRAGATGIIGTDLVAKAPASREQGSRLRDANVREQGESAVG